MIHFFLLLSSIPQNGCCHHWFKCWLARRPPGCFKFGLLLIMLLWIRTHFCMEIWVSFFFFLTPWSRMVAWDGGCIFNLLRNHKIVFSKLTASFCVPARGAGAFQFLHVLTDTWHSQLFNCSCSNRHAGVVHSSFDLHFLITDDVGNLFCAYWSSRYLLRRCDCSNLLPILKNWVVFLLLSFSSFLYIMDIIHLLKIWFANIFSHSVVCHLLPLMVSFKDKTFVLF